VDWSTKKVVVTGGASFIGSTLVDALITRGVKQVTVIDNLSSGKFDYIKGLSETGKVNFNKADITRLPVNILKTILHGPNTIVFHLAADHGGRGYIDSRQMACATNLMLDGMVFKACYEAGVEKVIFTSSGCVYPNGLQTDASKEVYLTEDMVGPPYDADNMYGWSKLMAERTLQAYHRDVGMKSASLRLFAVYGPRGKEDHAVMAMIARSFVQQDPFQVWGDGTQLRNWTHVDDIVEGIILAAEKVDDGTAINLGTMERTRVIDAAKYAIELGSYNPQIEFLLDKPVGPVNRVADNSLARKLLGWEPKIKFLDGVKNTYGWYVKNKDLHIIKETLEQKLSER
jgi:nucleoside-diphosphate-sugar epimerase